MLHLRTALAYRLVVLGLLCLVLVMAGLLYAVYAGWQARQMVVQPRVTARGVSMVGKMVCLPHKDQSGPQTMECAYGLQAADGTFYGLQDLDQQDLVSGKLSPGTKVTVQGNLQLAKSNEKYAVAGNIAVKQVN